MLHLDHAEQEPSVAGLSHDVTLGSVTLEAQVPLGHHAREPLAHRLRPLQHGLVDHGEGREWQDADHRPDPHRHDGAVGLPQLVVVEAVLVVPETLLPDRVGDEREVLEELDHEIRRRTAVPVQDRGDRGHAEGVRRHPAGRVGLLEREAGRQVGAVDRPDVVEPEEPAFEDVRAVLVLTVHPPGEVDEQLVEDAAEEVDVPAAVDGEHLERRQCLHGRVDVVEGPLVRRHRPVRMLEPLAAEERQLVLRERRVDVCERDAVEAPCPRLRTTDTPTCRAST